MKKLYLLLLIPFYLFGLTINQEVVDNYIQKENVIRNYVITYLYETGHLPLNKEELNNYFDLENSLYLNIYGEDNAIEIKTSNDGITLNNIISTDINKINDNVKYYYKNSVYLPTGLIISEDYSNNYLTYDSKTKSVINFINNLLDYEYVGVTEPDTSIYTSWYYPNGDGTFTLRKYDGTKWYLTNNNTPLTQHTYNENDFDETSSCVNDDTAKIFTEDGTIINYVCVSGKWTVLNTTTGTTLFNGYTDLHSLVCNMWDKAGSSTVYDIPVLPFTGEKKTFTKYDDSNENHNGYWISEDGKDIVTKNMKDLVWYRNKYGTQQTGYMCYNNNVIIAKWLGIGSNNNWVYLTGNYLDMYDNYKLNITDWNDNNNYYLSWNYQVPRDNNYKKIFQYDGEIYYSKYKFLGNINNIEDYGVQIAENKNIFKIFLDDTLYLTKTDNCSVDNNCFGTTTSQFNGNMIDNMYVFLYDTHNKIMVDARFIYNSSDIYGLMNNAVYYNKDIYYKKQDLNGEVCYQREDGKWITNNMHIIPDMYIINEKPTFPVGINCQNVNFTSDNVMILNNRTELANWFSSNIGTVAKVNGVTSYYTKMAKGDKDYWSNSSENISGYTRYDLPYVSNNSKNYLTKYLGTKGNLNDPNKFYRFSDNGLRSSIDNSFYNWFAAPTPKSINNMIDGDCQNIKYTSNPCDAKYNNKQFKFNNNRCEIDISNSECPVINGIQTVYDKSYDLCYISINEDNTYCNDKTMIYSKRLDKCYKKITDSSCNNSLYHYTTGTGQCRSTKDFTCGDCQHIENSCTTTQELSCVKGLDTFVYWNCSSCAATDIPSSYKKEFKLTKTRNYYYDYVYWQEGDRHTAYKDLTRYTYKNNSNKSLWIGIDNFRKEIKPGEEFGYGYKVIAWGSKKYLGTANGYSFYCNRSNYCSNGTGRKPFIYAEDRTGLTCPEDHLKFIPAGYSEGGSLNSPPQYYCDWGSIQTCNSTDLLNCVSVVRDTPRDCNDPQAILSSNTYYCFKNLAVNHNIKLNTIYGDVFINNVNVPNNMFYNKYKDRFEINPKLLNGNSIITGTSFKTTPYISLNYDYIKDKIYYNINNSLCSYTHMTYDIGLDTPYYPYSDGNCYSDLGKACVDSGFVQTQNF